MNKTVTTHTVLPRELNAEVNAFARANKLRKSEAVAALVRRGLAAPGNMESNVLPFPNRLDAG